MKRFLVVDGHNFLFRAFYGIPASAKTKGGVQVNAVYGFFAFLRKVVSEINPHYVKIVFDSENGITQKKMELPEYKEGRKNLPEEIFKQLDVIKALLVYRKIAFIEDTSSEADDLIGTLAASANNHGVGAYISSNDFDFMQLVNIMTSVVRQSRGKQEIYDKNKVFLKFGVTPIQYLDYLALRGDPSDNIKSIKGIGTKTASQLISRFGTIENILSNSASLNPRITKLLLDNKEKLLASKEFLRINTQLVSGEIGNIEEYKLDRTMVERRVNPDLINIGIR